MKLTKTVLYVGALSLLMGSCADESPWKAENSATGKGGIKLNLTSYADVTTNIPKVRAAEIQGVTPPPTSAFQIRLSKQDGSYVKTWTSMEDFAKEDKFSVGSYDLEAFYGTPDSQGVINSYSKGYENSYYYGVVENITVLEGRDTPVELGATLSNAVVIVEYTDAFKSYFTEWSTTLKTSAATDVEIGNKESTAYVKPGDVDIVIDATLQNGKKIFLNPAVFEAEPQHMYKIKYNIFDGNVGYGTLEINFDDEPSGEHNIYIELTDELVNGEAPVITTQGFDNGEEIETQTGVPMENKEVKLSVVAQSVIAKAVLKVSSKPAYSSSFLTNGEIDLCSATPEQQAAMKAAGIEARGFFNETGTMGYLDLTSFCQSLPSGTHEISLEVTDKLSKTNEEKVGFKVSIVDPKIRILENSIVKFGANYADIKVGYDGPDPTKAGNNPFSFSMMVPGTGIYQPVEIIGIGSDESPLSRAEYIEKNYVYRVSLPTTGADYYPVRMMYSTNQKSVDEEHQVDIEYPDYKLEFDPFAKSLRLRISDEGLEGENKKAFEERLRVFIDGKEVGLTNDDVSGIMTAGNLESSRDYVVKSTLKLKSVQEMTSEDYQTEDNIRTEAALEVPNGDFSQTQETIRLTKVQIGGKYTVKVIVGTDYTNYSDIVANEATGWASNNDITCKKDASNLNTWFVVPAVYVENGVCVVRSVGYNHAGSTPNTTGGQLNQNYFCTNTPGTNGLSTAAGKLFLGTYSYFGMEKEEGKEFSSRPKTLSFDYSYMPLVDGENAVVEIQILDASSNIICQTTKELDMTDNWGKDSDNLPYLAAPHSHVEISMDGYSFGSKADKLFLSFKSSQSETPNIHIPTGDELSEGLHASPTRNDGKYYLNDKDRYRPENSYHSFAMGAELKIANLSFEY